MEKKLLTAKRPSTSAPKIPHASAQLLGVLDGVAARTIREVVSSATLIDLPGRSPIYTAGEKRNAVYVILAGRVKLSLPVGASKKKMVEILQTGQWFGARESLLRDHQMTSAETIGATTLASLPASAVRQATAARSRIRTEDIEPGIAPTPCVHARDVEFHNGPPTRHWLLH